MAITHEYFVGKTPLINWVCVPIRGFVSLDYAKQIGGMVTNLAPLVPHGIIELSEDFPHLRGGQVKEGTSKPTINHPWRHGRRELNAIG